MTMQAWSFTGCNVDEDHARAHTRVLLTDEFVRRSVCRQLVLLEKPNPQHCRVSRRVELNLLSRRAVYMTTRRAKMKVGPTTIPLGTPNITSALATTASTIRKPAAIIGGRALRLRHERNIIAAARRQAMSSAARRR